MDDLPRFFYSSQTQTQGLSLFYNLSILQILPITDSSDGYENHYILVKQSRAPQYSVTEMWQVSKSWATACYMKKRK